jgi:hypothetical protein
VDQELLTPKLGQGLEAKPELQGAVAEYDFLLTDPHHSVWGEGGEAVSSSAAT